MLYTLSIYTSELVFILEDHKNEYLRHQVNSWNEYKKIEYFALLAIIRIWCLNQKWSKRSISLSMKGNEEASLGFELKKYWCKMDHSSYLPTSCMNKALEPNS